MWVGSPGRRRDLEYLLAEMVDAGVTRFVWLRQFEPGSNSADVNRLLDRLEHVRRLDIPEGLFRNIPAHRITRLRRQGERAASPTGSASSRTTAASRLSRSAPSSGRCFSPTRWWRPTTGSSAERIVKPPVPAKRSSGTRPPRSAGRSGHSPSCRLSARATRRGPTTTGSRGPARQRLGWRSPAGPEPPAPAPGIEAQRHRSVLRLGAARSPAGTSVTHHLRVYFGAAGATPEENRRRGDSARSFAWPLPT